MTQKYYYYSLLSKNTKVTIATNEDKKLLLPKLYASTNWKLNQNTASTLKEIITLPYLVTIVSHSSRRYL